MKFFDKSAVMLFIVSAIAALPAWGETVVLNAAPSTPVASVATSQPVKVTYATELLFEQGLAQVTPQSLEKLNRPVTKVLAIYLEVAIVAGRASSSEKDIAGDIALANKRAYAVQSALLTKGVDTERIYLDDLGTSSRVEVDTTPQSWALNRSVDIEVIGTKP